MNSSTLTIKDLLLENQKLQAQLERWKTQAEKWKTRCAHRTEQNKQLNQSVISLAQKLKEERAANIRTSSSVFKQNHVLHGYVFLPTEDIRKLTSDDEIECAVRTKLVWLIPWEERQLHLTTLYAGSPPSHVDLSSMSFAAIFLKTFSHTGPTIYVVVQYEDDMYNIVQGLVGTTNEGSLVLRLAPLKPNPIVSDCYTIKDAMIVLKKTQEQILNDVWVVIQTEQSYTFLPLAQLVSISFIPHLPLYNANTLTQVNEPVCLQAAINNFLSNYNTNEKQTDQATLALQRDLDDIFCDPHNAPVQPTSSGSTYHVPHDSTRLHDYFISTPSAYQAEFPVHPSVNVVARFVPTYAKELISSMMSNERPWFPNHQL